MGPNWERLNISGFLLSNVHWHQLLCFYFYLKIYKVNLGKLCSHILKTDIETRRLKLGTAADKHRELYVCVKWKCCCISSAVQSNVPNPTSIKIEYSHAFSSPTIQKKFQEKWSWNYCCFMKFMMPKMPFNLSFCWEKNKTKHT